MKCIWNFFKDLDREKFKILKLLEERKSTYTTFSFLMEQLGLSKFKLTQYLDVLNQDICKLNQRSKIEIINNNEIQVYGIDYLLVKKIRLMYLNESDIWGLFNSAFIEEISSGEYARTHFISRSNSYSQRNRLVKILKEKGISYQRNKLIGSEKEIRNFIFSVYFEVFNGLESPFPESIVSQIIKITGRLVSSLSLRLTPIRRIKLYFFIGVWITRISHGHNLIEPMISVDVFNSDQIRVISKDLSLVISHDEWKWLFSFLYCEELLLLDEKVNNNIQLFEELNSCGMAEKVVTTIFRNFTFEELDFSRQSYIKKLTRKLSVINLKNRLFYQGTDTFISDDTFLYFSENFPSLLRSINSIIEEFAKEQRIKNSGMLRRIYYDYLLAVLNIFPVSKLTTAVYVCVEFSHGSDYTKYVTTQIEEFRHINIVIQTNVTAKTDLYISDFALPEIKCKQIIWKNPPTPEDWEVFGDTVIWIKHSKDGRVT